MPASAELAQVFINNAAPHLGFLTRKWQDEYDFGGLDDEYKEAIELLAPPFVEDIKMLETGEQLCGEKFGFDFRIGQKWFRYNMSY